MEFVEMTNSTGIICENFTVELSDSCTVIGNVIILKDSCFVWIGSQDSEPAMSSLVTAMPTRFDSVPISTTLIQGEEDFSGDMAVRLSKRLGIQLFVSCNLSNNFVTELSAVDRYLVNFLLPYYNSNSDKA